MKSFSELPPSDVGMGGKSGAVCVETIQTITFLILLQHHVSHVS
jgi:hypothetical protein